MIANTDNDAVHGPTHGGVRRGSDPADVRGYASG